MILKNFLYVYKNYSVLESFADLARDNYLTEVKSVARPDLEVMRAAAVSGTPDDASDPETGNVVLNILLWDSKSRTVQNRCFKSVCVSV